MDQQLTNLVTATGTYNSIPTALSSDAVVVTMVSGLTITKTADKTVWADGPLTYTITLTNNATADYASPIVTDVLDNTLVDFVTDSVYINNTKAETSAYEYNSNTHTLTITLADVKASTTTVITFQVTKKST